MQWKGELLSVIGGVKLSRSTQICKLFKPTVAVKWNIGLVIDRWYSYGYNSNFDAISIYWEIEVKLRELYRVWVE